jgi:hypothetical protein
VSTPPAQTTSAEQTDLWRLRGEVSQLQNQRVDEWVRLIRFGAVVPLAVEESLSWKLTRPVRLAQTAIRVLRRDGMNQFLATARGRIRRMVTKK